MNLPEEIPPKTIMTPEQKDFMSLCVAKLEAELKMAEKLETVEDGKTKKHFSAEAIEAQLWFFTEHLNKNS